MSKDRYCVICGRWKGRRFGKSAFCRNHRKAHNLSRFATEAEFMLEMYGKSISLIEAGRKQNAF